MDRTKEGKMEKNVKKVKILARRTAPTKRGKERKGPDASKTNWKGKGKEPGRRKDSVSIFIGGRKEEWDRCLVGRLLRGGGKKKMGGVATEPGDFSPGGGKRGKRGGTTTGRAKKKGEDSEG